jgi:hypothetical protein
MAKSKSMKSGGKKGGFYSLTKILSIEAQYNVIIGERSNGKTYGSLVHAIDQYFNGNKGELAIVRRWQEDIRGNRAKDVFSSILEDGVIERLSGGLYTGIKYYGSKWYFCNYDDDGKAIYNEGDIFAHAFALSDTEHNKSISFPNIRTIIFDEFMTRGTYLPDEFVLFMNTVSTIVRQRKDVTIFMLGNTVNKYSPYFKEMGLTHVAEMKQGSIDVYSYGESPLKVAVEYCASVGTTKKSNVYFAFNNPKLEMITTGAWELDLYPHLPIKYTYKDVQLIYFIKFDGDIFQCEVIQKDGEMFTYIHDKTTPIKNDDKDIVYSLEYNHKFNYCRNIFKPVHKAGKAIMWFFKNDKVFYQNNSVGDSVNNYLKICRGMKG